MLNNIGNPIDFIKSLITRGNERSVNIKKNILALLIIRGCSIIISFISLPLTLHYINPTRYGIWLTLSSIIGWFTFFDIGFGNGLRNRFTESVAKGQHELARIYVSTTYALLSILIGVVLLFFFCINPFLNWAKILNTRSDMSSELSIVALVVFVFFCFQFILQLITTLVTANHQPAKASLYNLIGSLLSLAVIFILTKTTSGKLIYLAIAFGLAPVLVLVVSSLWLYTHQYRNYAPALKFVRFRYARNLMNIGIKFFFIQIAFIVLYQTSNIIIAQLFGPKEVTPFNIVYKYFGIITMIFGIIMMPFWSAFTEAWTKSDIQWIKQTLRKLKIWWLIMGVITMIMLVFSNFAYRIWVGSEIKIPLSVSIVVAAYVIINTWNGIYSQFLNGVGKIKLQLYSGFWGMILNIPMAILLGRKIGITGVVLSTVILGVVNMIWGPIQTKKLLTNTATGIWNK
jgi:O-antigen/teichoic acid export membrane protein